MPTVNQGMLDQDQVSATSTGQLGPVGGGSRSHTNRLAAAYPDGPQSTGINAKTTTIDGVVVTMSRAGYRTGYETTVLQNAHIDAKAAAGLDNSFDMTFTDNNPPTLTSLPVPEGESAQGTDGATIIESGLGPNVNNTGLNEEGNMIMVDASGDSSPPFPGSSAASPSTTSAIIGDGGIHQGGVTGKSPASPA